ncbi:unnamed protein product [Closterium sp. NIES-53]
MALRPSSVPLRVPLPPPPESSLPAIPDPESDLARATSPTVSPLLTTVVTDPSFWSTDVSALVAELVEFTAACRLDYASALVVESESASPPSVGGECALGTDVLEDRQEDFECLAAAVPRFASMLLAPDGDPGAPDIPTARSYTKAITDPYSSQWQAAMDTEMASWKSTCTYVDAVPPSRANIVDGMWIFRALQRFAFFFSSPQPTPLSTGHLLSAPPSDESVEPSGPYPVFVGCLISSCEAEIYAGAMAAQELRWLTYLLIDLGGQPCSPPVLYVDNKAMIALCQEHRLEHRTKHIALRYW